MSENRQSKPVNTTHRIRRFIIYAALLLAAFLLGFVPMWWLNSQCSSSLSEAERQPSLAKMQNSLGSAAIDARRGDGEIMRQPVKLPVTFSLSYGQKRAKALSQPSRRHKKTAHSPCLPSVTRSSLC